jgi:hypothetical protein
MEKVKLATSKITGYTGDADAKAIIPVIVNVNQADYIPEGVDVRQKITSYIFTSNVKHSDLAILDKDKQVVSVAVSRPLKIID